MISTNVIVWHRPMNSSSNDFSKKGFFIWMSSNMYILLFFVCIVVILSVRSVIMNSELANCHYILFQRPVCRGNIIRSCTFINFMWAVQSYKMYFWRGVCHFYVRVDNQQISCPIISRDPCKSPESVFSSNGCARTTFLKTRDLWLILSSNANTVSSSSESYLIWWVVCPSVIEL